MMKKAGLFPVWVFVIMLFGSLVYSMDIYDAAKAGNLETVRRYLKDDPGWVDSTDKKGQTALNYASYTGKLEIAEFLINKGANVNHRNRSGMTAAHYAVQRNRKEALRLLIRSKADLSLKNDKGETPVALAFKRENGDVVDVILETEVIRPDNPRERTFYLHRAARMGKYRLAADLLTDDVIHSRDEKGRSVLHNAAAGGLIEIVKKTLSKGNEINAADIYGSSPLHEAVVYNHLEMVEFLIDNGVDTDLKRPDGSTALCLATEMKNETMVKLLLSKGVPESSAKKDFPLLIGPFLGQNPPGDKAMLFAPGIVSKAESYDHMYGFFNNNTMFLYESYRKGTKRDWTQVPIPIMEYRDGKWSEPYESSVPGRPWFYNVPGIPAGERYFFAWSKNLNGSGPPSELYLWSAVKTSEGWSDPRRLPPPVNTGFDTWPNWSEDGRLYFHSKRGGGFGRTDIWVSEPVNGNYTEVSNAGPRINSEYTEHDPFIARDGSYILWSSYKPEGFGEDDIYIAFKKRDGTWTEAQNLGEGVNTPHSENRVFVTSDEKYIFFASSRYGLWDIFWLSAEIIDSLKPEESKNHN